MDHEAVDYRLELYFRILGREFTIEKNMARTKQLFDNIVNSANPMHEICFGNWPGEDQKHSHLSACEFDSHLDTGLAQVRTSSI